MDSSRPPPAIDNGDSFPHATSPAPTSVAPGHSPAKPGVEIKGNAESEAPRPATSLASAEPPLADSAADATSVDTTLAYFSWPALPDASQPSDRNWNLTQPADSLPTTPIDGPSQPVTPITPIDGTWQPMTPMLLSRSPSTTASFVELVRPLMHKSSHATNGKAPGPMDHYPSFQSIVQSVQSTSRPPPLQLESTVPSSPSATDSSQPLKGENSHATNGNTPGPTNRAPNLQSTEVQIKDEKSHATNGNVPGPMNRSLSIQSAEVQIDNIRGTPATAQPQTDRRKLSSKCKCHCDNACNCSCLCMHYCICQSPCDKKCASLPSQQVQDGAQAKKKEPRNLIVSIDGTSNQFGKFNTNVVELHSRVLAEFTEGEGDAQRPKKVKQMKCYLSGIGTALPPDSWFYTRWRVKFGNLIDLAIAWRFEQIVKEAYEWLMNHYKPGDRIFLFGFSRGAYQIRTIAGIIHTLGLLHAGNHSMVSFAYDLYLQNHRRLRKQNGDDELRQTVNNFKKTFSHEVQIHFIGAWDTVSSIGVVKDMPLPFTDKTDHVCFFRHALALDEGRIKFIPEYLSSPVNLIQYGKHVSDHSTTEKDIDEVDSRPNSRGASGMSESEKSSQSDSWRSAKEVWFSGSHSDVGGGYKDNLQLNSASIPLVWMENEARLAGLKLDDSDKDKKSHIEWDWDALAKEKPTESMTVWWRILEYLPIVWFVASDEAGASILDHSNMFLVAFFTFWGVILVGLPTWLAVKRGFESAVDGHWAIWAIALYSYIVWAYLLLLIQLSIVLISLFEWGLLATLRGLLTIFSFGVLPLQPGFTMSAHQCKGRVIRGDQLIHVSVAFKNAGKYTPKAKLPGFDWKSLVGKGRVDGQTVNDISWAHGLETVLEMDLFDSSSVQDQLEEFKKATSEDRKARIFQRMAFMVMSDKGARTVAQDEKFINETLEQIKNTHYTPVFLAGVVAFIARLYKKNTPTLQKHVVTVIPQLVGHIKTYLGSSVPATASRLLDTSNTEPTSEIVRSAVLEKTAGDIVNHSMALITTFIDNDSLYVWTDNPLETVNQPASISIFIQALRYRETRYQAVELLTALLGGYDPDIAEEIEKNDGVKSLINILDDCDHDHDLPRKVVRCLARLDLISDYKHKERIFNDVFPRLLEITTQKSEEGRKEVENLPLRVSAIQAFIEFRGDTAVDDTFVSIFVAKEVHEKLQKLVMNPKESLILRLVSSEVLATVIGDKPESIKLQDNFLRGVIHMLHRPMSVMSLNQALGAGGIQQSDLRYFCSKSKCLSQSNLALPILLALTRAPEEIALRVWNLGILSKIPRLLASGDDIVLKWFTACLRRLARQDNVRQIMLERANIPANRRRQLTALEHWFSTLLIRMPTFISTATSHWFFLWLWTTMSSDWWIVRKEIEHHRFEMQKTILISSRKFIIRGFDALPELISGILGARVTKWTDSMERIASGLDNTDMKLFLKMLRDPEVSCHPDMIDFLAQLVETADFEKYGHSIQRVLRTILAIGSKSQENMDTRENAYTTIQDLCKSETIRNVICSEPLLLSKIVAPMHSELSCHPKLIDMLIALSGYSDVVSHPALEKLLTSILEVCTETKEMGIRLYIFDAVVGKLSGPGSGNTEPLKLMLRNHIKQFRATLLRLLDQNQPLVTIKDARAEIGMDSYSGLGKDIDPWRKWWSSTYSTSSTLIAPRTLALSFLYRLSCVIEKDPHDEDTAEHFVSVIWNRRLISSFNSIFYYAESDDIVTKKLAVWLVNYMIDHSGEKVKTQILRTGILSTALRVSDELEGAGHSLPFKKCTLSTLPTAESQFELGWSNRLGSYWN